MDSTRHRLLISAPNLGDDNFDQTVVLMIEHDAEGALGLVLNRPSETTVSEHLPALADIVATPQVFFLGGPVSLGGMLALGRRGIDAPVEHTTPVEGPVVLVEPDPLVNGRVDGIELVRLFTGYSGWAGGQLEAELAAGAWHVATVMPDDVFCLDPDALWRTVMRRQGGRLAAQGLFPDDLSVN